MTTWISELRRLADVCREYYDRHGRYPRDVMEVMLAMIMEGGAE